MFPGLSGHSRLRKDFPVMLGIVLATAPICVSAKVVSMVDTGLDVGDCMRSGVECKTSTVLAVLEGRRNVGVTSDQGDAHYDKCVISGVVNRCAPYRWTGWEAVHIFLLETMKVHPL